MKTRTPLITKLLFATTLALIGAYFAITTVRVGGIANTNWTETDLIRDRAPIRLVQPEWVSNTPDKIMNWVVAETCARLGLILTLWVVSLILIVRSRSEE